MANNAIIQKTSYFTELENIHQAAIVGSVIRIVAGESTFEREENILGKVLLKYPKDERKPITFAYDDLDISNIGFHRVDEKSSWNKVEIYPTNRNSNPYHRYLPNFTKTDFLQLNLKFKNSSTEQEKDNDPNNPITHTIHMFDYSYKVKDGAELLVRFRVSENMYKAENTYPRNFDAVFVIRND
ncbi:MAG: hypothetical protein P4L91_01515 [Burkholderiaceae bacterium]|nr:hypothetical protein [Burkholderiaceae bacterium]